METLASINSAYNLGRGHNKNEGNAPNRLQGRSPYQSPVHSVFSLNAANKIPSTRHRSLEKGEVSVSFPNDPSIDHQIERLQMMIPTALEQCSEISNSSTMPVSREDKRYDLMNYSSHEHLQERGQYPYMGARSPERDQYCHVSNKSKSDRPDFTSQLQLTQEQFRNLSRDSLVLELQSQITDLNKDCVKMHEELDSTKDKLSSTMNSIKTFWSPELKKERSLRKEESAKNSLLNEQYKATQAELKKFNKLSDGLDHAQVQLRQQQANTHMLQVILEAKTSRIAALEKELMSTEDKLNRLGECDHDQDGSLKKDRLTSKEKALKIEIDMLKTDVGTRDNEIVGLKMKLDTLMNQEREHKQYINVLKDQIKSKEEQASMFQADIDDMRDRLKDKDDAIDKKLFQSQMVTVEKRKLELECAELKDNLDTKERKINVLLQKIEKLEELITEKEDQLTQVKTQSTHLTESSDSAISAMEESISEKDRQIIEKLREQSDVVEVEHQHDRERLESVSQQLKARLNQLQLELSDKQLKAATAATQTNIDTTDQLSELNHSVDQGLTEVKSAESEVGQLLDRLKECENEKNEKESQIKELQDTLKEYEQKFGTQQQHKEKHKNASLFGEAWRREEGVSTDTQHLMGSVKEKDGHLGELEGALCESVKITAEREMLLIAQKMQIDASQNKIEELQAELEKTKHVTKEYASKLASYVKSLEEKDSKLKRMASERHKHLEEVFDMKQEALQAAIYEKDANIALLEMTSSKNPHNMQEIDRMNREKDKFNQQRKELVHNRTKYLQERIKGHKRSMSKEPKPEEKDDKSMEPATLVKSEQDTKNS